MKGFFRDSVIIAIRDFTLLRSLVWLEVPYSGKLKEAIPGDAAGFFLKRYEPFIVTFIKMLFMN